jgi:hypothetical protein
VMRAGDSAAQCVCQAWYHDGPLVDRNETPRSCHAYGPTCLGCNRRWDDLVWNPEETDD